MRQDADGLAFGRRSGEIPGQLAEGQLQADLEQVRRRFVASLVGNEDHAGLAAAAAALVAELGEDGRWADIDYADDQLGPWRAAVHCVRTRTIARAVASGCCDAVDSALRALSHWLEADYRNPNWWHNRIGTPMAIGDIALLLDEHLDSEQRRQAAAIIARADYAEMTGQNLVWTACIWLRHGLLTACEEEVEAAAKRLAAVIHIAEDAEGVQADHSFHQHGRVLYSGGYGANFAADCAWGVWVFARTRFAVPVVKVQILSAYVLDGLRWTVRGECYDFGVIGREISRPGHRVSHFIEACRHLADTSCVRQAEFGLTLAQLANDAAPVCGVRSFWRSDFLVAQRDDWYMSVRMFSSRLDNTDLPCCGGEGRRSHHVADGATCIRRRGDEYADLYPAWNWRRLPGTTVEQQPGELLAASVRCTGRRDFVGCLADDDHGIAAMQLARDDSTLTACKAWFMLPHESICLGAGIACDSELPVVTTINQCHARGPAQLTAADGTTHVIAGRLAIPAGSVVRHDGLVYTIEPGASASCAIESRTGDWQQIGVATAPAVAVEVFELVLEHGCQPADGTYSYRVAGELAPDAPSSVICNTTRLQAVKTADRVLIVFGQAARLTFASHQSCEVDRPCLIMLHVAESCLTLSLADPTQQLDSVNVLLRHPAIGRRSIRLRLPRGANAGATMTLRLALTKP